MMRLPDVAVVEPDVFAEGDQGAEAAGDSERWWASVWRRPIRWLVMVPSKGLNAWCGTNQRATGGADRLRRPQEVEQ
jgi:hypothetical protein